MQHQNLTLTTTTITLENPQSNGRRLPTLILHLENPQESPENQMDTATSIRSHADIADKTGNPEISNAITTQDFENVRAKATDRTGDITAVNVLLNTNRAERGQNPQIYAEAPGLLNQAPSKKNLKPLVLKLFSPEVAEARRQFLFQTQRLTTELRNELFTKLTNKGVDCTNLAPQLFSDHEAFIGQAHIDFNLRDAQKAANAFKDWLFAFLGGTENPGRSHDPELQNPSREFMPWSELSPERKNLYKTPGTPQHRNAMIMFTHHALCEIVLTDNGMGDWDNRVGEDSNGQLTCKRNHRVLNRLDDGSTVNYAERMRLNLEQADYFCAGRGHIFKELGLNFKHVRTLLNEAMGLPETHIHNKEAGDKLMFIFRAQMIKMILDHNLSPSEGLEVLGVLFERVQTFLSRAEFSSSFRDFESGLEYLEQFGVRTSLDRHGSLQIDFMEQRWNAKNCLSNFVPPILRRKKDDKPINHSHLRLNRAIEMCVRLYRLGTWRDHPLARVLLDGDFGSAHLEELIKLLPEFELIDQHTLLSTLSYYQFFDSAEPENQTMSMEELSLFEALMFGGPYSETLNIPDLEGLANRLNLVPTLRSIGSENFRLMPEQTRIINSIIQTLGIQNLSQLQVLRIIQLAYASQTICKLEATNFRTAKKPVGAPNTEALQARIIVNQPLSSDDRVNSVSMDRSFQDYVQRRREKNATKNGSHENQGATSLTLNEATAMTATQAESRPPQDAQNNRAFLVFNGFSDMDTSTSANSAHAAFRGMDRPPNEVEFALLEFALRNQQTYNFEDDDCPISQSCTSDHEEESPSTMGR